MTEVNVLQLNDGREKPGHWTGEGSCMSQPKQQVVLAMKIPIPVMVW